MNQVHGKNVFVVSKNDDGKTIDDCDGLLTNDQNVTLVVRTADCLPISLIDKKHHAIGLVHAGWRGLHKKIIRNAIGLMVGNFQTEPSDLHIEIGPHICANHYEVGPEVSRFFNNEKYLDLSKIAAEQLVDLGVLAKNIKFDKRCTYEDPNLPSYRRNKTSERLITELHI
jgi:YfiH family protein